MQGRLVRNAVPQSPRPSGRSSSTDTLTCRVVSAVGPAAATMSSSSLSGLTRAMVVEVNLPPFAAALHTSSNSSARDLARMIASLVALSAANIRVRRSFWLSVLAFSSARSKFPIANDTLSASRCSSSANSGVNVSFSEEMKNMTPTALAGNHQRERRARHGAVAVDELMKRRSAGVGRAYRWRCRPGGSGKRCRTVRVLPDDPR